MLRRMLRADLRRTLGTSTVLSALVALAALLAALGGSALVQLNGSLAQLFADSRTPDIVQMHVGEIDAAAIQEWAQQQPDVADSLVSTTLPIPVDELYLGQTSEAGSVLEPAVTVQNENFDFLLGLDGQPVQVEPGQIALPVYYALERGSEVGDAVSIRYADRTFNFEVSEFVRDSTMNSSFVTSKRLLVAPEDLAAMTPYAGEPEYLIEFLVADGGQARSVVEAYGDSGLPANGMLVERSLFYLANALSHGLVIAVLALMAVLLIAVAVIALRFSVLTAMERDLREIGVMKAIGLPKRSVRRLYLVKYAALVTIGGVVGLLASIPLSAAVTLGMRYQIGSAQGSLWEVIVPVVSALLVVLLVVGMVALVLRRLDKVSAMDALRAGATGQASGRRGWIGRLMRRDRTNRRARRGGLAGTSVPSPAWMGLNDIGRNPRVHGMLLSVLTLCTFLMVVPLNLFTSVSSPEFTTYTGVGISDLRVQLRTQETVAQAPQIQQGLASDEEVARFAPLVTARFEVQNAEGEWESLNVENGDHTVFPIAYLDGVAATSPDQIALSSLAASGLGVTTGDTINLDGLTAGHELTVSGIYQDVTSGGRTAKSVLPTAGEPIIWNTIALDVAETADLQTVANRIEATHPGAQAIDVQEFSRQNLGELIGQTRTMAVAAALVALVLAFLITTLFATMVIARDTSQIAIQRGLGVPDRRIRGQYLTRFIAVLLAGVAVGTVLVATLGEYGVAAIFGSTLGAPALRFDVNPWLAYGLLPLALAVTVALATVLATRTFHRTTVTHLSQE